MDESTISAIFTRFVLLYGVRKVGALCQGQEPVKVHEFWQKELDGLTKASVALGLRHLPFDYPPNALQFRALCEERQGAEREQALRLSSKARVISSEALDKLKQIASEASKARDPIAWAYQLRACESQGERLTQFQRSAWRNALRLPLEGWDSPKKSTT